MSYDRYQKKGSGGRSIETKPTAPVTVEGKRFVVGHKYFVKYIGPQRRLSISPGLGRVEQGVEYQVGEELYYALRGLEGWTARTEEVFGQ